jgi:hypothetical protein
MCDTGNHVSGNHRTFLNAHFCRESFSGKSLKKTQVRPGGEIKISLFITNQDVIKANFIEIDSSDNKSSDGEI